MNDIIQKIQKHEFDITKIAQKSFFGLVYKKGFNTINIEIKTFNVFSSKIRPKIVELYNNKQIDDIRKYYQDNKEQIYSNINDEISKAIPNYIECKKLNIEFCYRSLIRKDNFILYIEIQFYN